MPPFEEDQLSSEEMTLISSWIGRGGSADLKYSDLDISDPAITIIDKLIADSKTNRWSGLPDISDEELAELSSNYIRILRLYNRSDALQVIVYAHKNYESTGVSRLKSIAENIIELNFSGIQVQDYELNLIGLCQNLEKLNLSNTGLNDEGLNNLKNLEKLIELKIYNSNISDKALDQIANYPELSSLYVYNTDLTQDGIDRLARARSGIFIMKDASEAKDFKSVLPSPSVDPRIYFFLGSARIKLNHPLKDINLYYTTDGSIPDETSEKAFDSLEFDKSAVLKFFATRSGWEPSQVDSMNIYKTIRQPDNYILKNQPNKRFIGRGVSLLFDKEKGTGNFGDSTWMAFREESFVLNAEWEEGVTIKSVILSTMVNTDPYLFPPELIRIKGGMDKSDMQVLALEYPEKLEKRAGRHFRFLESKFDPVAIRYLEIVVQPLQRIPMWHPGKGEKGWFFIDEVVVEQ
jgi:hypothetical protein